MTSEEPRWAVFKGYRYSVGQVTRITEKKVMTRSHSRERHHDKSEVVFIGGEKEARDLLSVLDGLDSRRERAKIDLYNQRTARVRAAIAKATTPSGAE